HSVATQPAATTRPRGLGRSRTTQPASTTRPTVLGRSTTQPAVITSHWDLERASILRRAIETLTSATRVWLASRIPFVSAGYKIRRRHLSRESLGQPWRMGVGVLLIPMGDRKSVVEGKSG